MVHVLQPALQEYVRREQELRNALRDKKAGSTVLELHQKGIAEVIEKLAEVIAVPNQVGIQAPRKLVMVDRERMVATGAGGEDMFQQWHCETCTATFTISGVYSPAFCPNCGVQVTEHDDISV